MDFDTTQDAQPKDKGYIRLSKFYFMIACLAVGVFFAGFFISYFWQATAAYENGIQVGQRQGESTAYEKAIRDVWNFNDQLGNYRVTDIESGILQRNGTSAIFVYANQTRGLPLNSTQGDIGKGRLDGALSILVNPVNLPVEIVERYQLDVKRLAVFIDENGNRYIFQIIS